MQFFFVGSHGRPWHGRPWNGPPWRRTAAEWYRPAMLLSKGPIFLDVGRFGWFNLAFLSSRGHGTTQLPSEKLLSYSCETSKARIFENFREFWWCWKLRISASTEYLWNVFGISMEYDWNWRFQVQHWKFDATNRLHFQEILDLGGSNAVGNRCAMFKSPFLDLLVDDQFGVRNLPFTCWDNSIWESLHYTYFHHYRYPNQDHNHYHYHNCYHYH